MRCVGPGSLCEEPAPLIVVQQLEWDLSEKCELFLTVLLRVVGDVTDFMDLCARMCFWYVHCPRAKRQRVKVGRVWTGRDLREREDVSVYELTSMCLDA